MRHSTSVAKLALTIVLLIAAVAAVCQAEQQMNLLLNGGAEIGKGDLPSVWFTARVPADGLRMWRDVKNPHTGKACLAITNKHEYDQSVSNNWAQSLQSIPRGEAVRLSVQIRTEDAEAANVCVQYWAKDGKKMLAFQSTPVFRGDNDWTLVRSRDIIVPRETASIVVRAALTGQGTVFFDNISLEIVSEEAPPAVHVDLARTVKGRILQVLPVQKDCMVLSYMPDWGHGSLDNLAVGNHDGGVRTIVQLPAISNQYLARQELQFLLALYSRNTISYAPPGQIGLYRVIEKWNEKTSWKTIPRSAADPDGTFAFVPGKGWKLFDASSAVQAMSKPNSGDLPVYGLMLRFTDESRSGRDNNWTEYQFVSSEGSGRWKVYRPTLLVVDPTQPQVISSTPILDIEDMLKLPEAEFQEYVRKYPPSAGDILEMNTLGLQYESTGRVKDARRIFRRAFTVAADGPYATLIQVTRAHVEIQAGRLNEAEDILRRVMEIPVPESSIHDGRRVVHILFTAPQYMAKIFQKRGQFDEADRILAKSGDTAYKLAKAHPDVGYLPSHVAGAYYHRVRLLLESNPGSFAKARQLAEECRTQVPEYKGPCDYGQIIRWIEHYERQYEKNKKPGSQSGPSGNDRSGALIPGQVYEGVTFLASSVGTETSVEDIVQFAQACQLNFVIFDFAWITHHWPRTDFRALNKVCDRLQKAGVNVAAMYRPRALRPSDAKIHYALKNGSVAESHNELCFAHEDSVTWGSGWGTRILSQMPLVDKVIIYNLRSPCTCPKCKDARGRKHAAKFLDRCRAEWRRIRPSISIGHVGMGDEYIEKFDFVCPFIPVNRTGDSPIDLGPVMARLRALRSAHADKPLIPLMKVCWASGTQNTSTDVIRAIKRCRQEKMGFVLWYYGWIFHSTEKRYDGKAITKALGGDWTMMPGDADALQDRRRATEAIAALRANKPYASDQVVAAGEAAVDGLAQILADRKLDGTLRFTAANILGDIGSRRAVGPLLKALKDPYFNIRRCAALALGKIGDPKARRPLMSLAEKDPFAWRDPKTNQVRYLVREDARKALQMLSGKGTPSRKTKADTAENTSIRLARLAKQAPDLTFPYKQEIVEKLPWPHQQPNLNKAEADKLNREVWVINDFPLYQADEEGQWRYFHGALDIVLDNGTKIYAMKDGWVKAIKGSTVIIADVPGGKSSYGWEYTHLGDFQVKVGGRVKKGTHIGNVSFHGLPHIHLTKVFSQGKYWGEWAYACMPNSHFTYTDEEPPVVKLPFYFFKNGTNEMVPADEAGNVRLGGKVDIVVGMREAGLYARSNDNGFGDRLGVARIQYEIAPIDGADRQIHRFSSFDFGRIQIKKGYDARGYGTELTKVVYKHWKLFEANRPHGSQTFSYYVVTNCPGKESPNELSFADGDYCWDTSATNGKGDPVFPNGQYKITVKAYDASGNATKKTMTVSVDN